MVILSIARLQEPTSVSLSTQGSTPFDLALGHAQHPYKSQNNSSQKGPIRITESTPGSQRTSESSAHTPECFVQMLLNSAKLDAMTSALGHR